MTLYIPVTPAGTPVFYGAGILSGKRLAAGSKEKAIENLLKDAAYMPYKTWENFQKRGYTIAEMEDIE